jgi:hypothetical protein
VRRRPGALKGCGIAGLRLKAEAPRVKGRLPHGGIMLPRTKLRRPYCHPQNLFSALHPPHLATLVLGGVAVLGGGGGAEEQGTAGLRGRAAPRPPENRGPRTPQAPNTTRATLRDTNTTP